jgi:hypothetical protein
LCLIDKQLLISDLVARKKRKVVMKVVREKKVVLPFM